nr:hypothetical protein [Tanacetum cinerariifolium]
MAFKSSFWLAIGHLLTSLAQLPLDGAPSLSRKAAAVAALRTPAEIKPVGLLLALCLRQKFNQQLMGLDVLIITDNYEQLSGKESDNDFEQHSLSRTFCNFTFRVHSIANGGATELEQIGRLTGIDITPIRQMQEYPEEEHLEFQLSIAKSIAEQQALLTEYEADKAALSGNLPAVLATVQQLLERLALIGNLPDLLDAHGNDTLGYDYYFTDFLVDKGQGYIGNNFGQDLRNFERFLQFTQSHGATTAWFSYG